MTMLACAYPSCSKDALPDESYCGEHHPGVAGYATR